jgi:hypothetical protein
MCLLMHSLNSGSGIDSWTWVNERPLANIFKRYDYIPPALLCVERRSRAIHGLEFETTQTWDSLGSTVSGASLGAISVPSIAG